MAQYGSDPARAPSFTPSGAYCVVALSAGNAPTSTTISDCNLCERTGLEWFNPVTNSGAANVTGRDAGTRREVACVPLPQFDR